MTAGALHKHSRAAECLAWGSAVSELINRGRRGAEAQCAGRSKAARGLCPRGRGRLVLPKPGGCAQTAGGGPRGRAVATGLGSSGAGPLHGTGSLGLSDRLGDVSRTWRAEVCAGPHGDIWSGLCDGRRAAVGCPASEPVGDTPLPRRAVPRAPLPPTPSSLRAFIHSSVHSFIPPCIHSFIPPCIHSFLPPFIPSSAPSPPCASPVCSACPVVPAGVSVTTR